MKKKILAVAKQDKLDTLITVKISKATLDSIHKEAVGMGLHASAYIRMLIKTHPTRNNSEK